MSEAKAKAAALIREARQVLLERGELDTQTVAQINRLGSEAALLEGDPFKAPDAVREV